MTKLIERRLERLEHPTGKRPLRVYLRFRDADGNCWRRNEPEEPTAEDEERHIVVICYGKDGEDNPPPEEMGLNLWQAFSIAVAPLHSTHAHGPPCGRIVLRQASIRH